MEILVYFGITCVTLLIVAVFFQFEDGEIGAGIAFDAVHVGLDIAAVNLNVADQRKGDHAVRAHGHGVERQVGFVVNRDGQDIALAELEAGRVVGLHAGAPVPGCPVGRVCCPADRGQDQAQSAQDLGNSTDVVQ